MSLSRQRPTSLLTMADHALTMRRKRVYSNKRREINALMEPLASWLRLHALIHKAQLSRNTVRCI
jgi:hypothetical protein